MTLGIIHRLLLLSLCVLFPFDWLQRFELAGFGIRVSQCLAIVAVWLLTAEALVTRRKVPCGALSMLVSVYICYASVSAFFTIAPDAATLMIVYYLSMVVYIGTVYWLLSRTQVSIRAVLMAIYYITVLMCVFGVVQAVVFRQTGLTLGLLPDTTGDHLRARAYGFYLEPNWYGVYLAAWGPYHILLSFKGHAYGIGRFAGVFGMAVWLAAIVASQNRGVVVSLFALAMLYIVSRLTQRRLPTLPTRAWAAIGLLLVILGIVLVAEPSLIDSAVLRLVDELVDPTESAAGGRVKMYVALLNGFAAEPLLGNGVASWTILCRGLNVFDESNIDFNAAAPSELLRVAAEYGAIGLFLVSCMALVLWKRYRNNQRLLRTLSQVWLHRAAGYSVLVFCFCSFFYGVRGMMNAFFVFPLSIYIISDLARRWHSRPHCDGYGVS